MLKVSKIIIVNLIAQFIGSALANIGSDNELENLISTDTHEEKVAEYTQQNLHSKLLIVEQQIKLLESKISYLEDTNKNLNEKLSKLNFSTNSSKEIILKAQSLVEKHKNSEAIKILESFIIENPNNELDEMYYLLGKICLSENMFAKSGTSFLKYYKFYPNKYHAPECLLNAAKSFRNLNRSDKACLLLEKLEKEYSEKIELLKSQILLEKKRNGCKSAQK